MQRRIIRVAVAVAVSTALALPVLPSDAQDGAASNSIIADLAGPADFSAAEMKVLPRRADLVKTVRHMVSLAPRRTGTKNVRKAARYVAQRFRDAGLDEVFMEKATSFSWSASHHSLKVNGVSIPETPVSFSLIGGPTATGTRTLGKSGLTTPVIDLGLITPENIAQRVANVDLRGKIVMVDLKFLTPLVALTPLMEFLYDPFGEIVDAQTLLTPNPYITSEEYVTKVLQEAGAAGVIGVLADYFESNKYHNEYHRRTPMVIPGVWITKKDAATMRKLMSAGDGTATMRLTTKRRKVTTYQPIGILRGRTNQTVMVQSHHDSMGPGAVEDGTGTAEVVGLADYYGALAQRKGYRRPEKTLMFTTFETHFTGYQAHMHFIDKYVEDPNSPYDIVLNDTIEHVAKKGRIGADGELELLNESEPRGFFENVGLTGKALLASSIIKREMNATTILNGNVMQPVGIPTDASFILTAGVPTISLIAGPIYLYDEADTMAAVDRRSLRKVLMVNRDIIEWALATPKAQIAMPTTIPTYTGAS